jgi:hypothetical protein
MTTANPEELRRDVVAVATQTRSAAGSDRQGLRGLRGDAAQPGGHQRSHVGQSRMLSVQVAGVRDGLGGVLGEQPQVGSTPNLVTVVLRSRRQFGQVPADLPREECRGYLQHFIGPAQLADLTLEPVVLTHSSVGTRPRARKSLSACRIR